MAVRGQDIASVIKRQIEEFGQELTMTDVGVVVEVGDGIARIHGLSGVGSTELLEYLAKIKGMSGFIRSHVWVPPRLRCGLEIDPEHA